MFGSERLMTKIDKEKDLQKAVENIVKAENLTCSQIKKIFVTKQYQPETTLKEILYHVNHCIICQEYVGMNLGIGNSKVLKIWMDENLIPSHKLLTLIDTNSHLKNLELQGFLNGDKKGKTMRNMNQSRIWGIVEQQFDDLASAKTNSEKLKALADLRNVAGLMFLLIDNPKAFEEGDTNIQ